MIKAGDKLVVCGPPDRLREDDPAASFEGRMGSRLWVLSAKDGAVLEQQELSEMPLFDGMMAADGKLFIAGKDGSLRCFK